MSTTTWPFIHVDENGMAYIQGTRTKVIEVALDRLAHHWDADEIHRQYPHLSLAQIHSALAYYYDHQDECDRLIEARRQRTEEIRRQTEDVELQKRLHELSRQ